MSFPTFADLKTQIRSLLNESTAAFWTDAELNRLINDAERDIAAKALCIENIDTAATVASTRLVPFSGHKVLRVEYTDVVSLVRILPKALGRLPSNGATPQYWFQWGYQIVIDPMPATAYNLNLYIADYPTYEMSETTDEPQIPRRFHENIIMFVLCRALMKDRKFTTAGNLYKTYISELSIARQQVIERYTDGYNAVKIPDRIVQGNQGQVQGGQS